jgi:type VI secretion system VasD/TssJ family lipoprotein
MRRLATAAGLVAAALVLEGCWRRKPPEPPAPPVHDFCLESSPRLNWYDGASHTVYVRLFQLSSLDAFAQTEAGRLLDPALVLPGLEGTPMQRTVHPGSKVSVQITQEPQARWLGVVAGYYRVDGSAKAHRAIAEAGDGRCMQLGPNGITAP